MPRAPLPLEYAGEHTLEGPLRLADRLHIAAGLYPLLFLTLLHALWGVEYVAAGHPPTPLNHGPANQPMTALYWAVFSLFLGGIPIGILSVTVAGTALATERGRGRQLAGLTLAAWLLSLVVFALDPVGAWNFYLD